MGKHHFCSCHPKKKRKPRWTKHKPMHSCKCKHVKHVKHVKHGDNKHARLWVGPVFLKHVHKATKMKCEDHHGKHHHSKKHHGKSHCMCSKRHDHH